MIGVIAKAADRPVVREFFELFKTPWEEYCPEQSYEVVIMCDDENMSVPSTRLLVQYSTFASSVDGSVLFDHGIGGRNLSYKGRRVPIYGVSAVFRKAETVFLEEEASGAAVGYHSQIWGGRYCRIGYDLFGEIRTLLAGGQPPEQASIPTVELHIAILRDLITEAGVTLVEVPPIPQGYSFVACLTHDVDHPAMRFHGWDHTMLGFLYRALWGSLVQWVNGRRPLSHLMKNYVAAVKAPLVLLGLAKDGWRDFGRYQELEGGAPSTFFVIPFRGRSGMTVSGPAPGMRASSYGAEDIADDVKALRISGAEIGLHGIDAWIDGVKGKEEKTEIAKFAEGRCDGVRMHWLYFRDDSHEILEKAGFAYDSTVGYNQTIGYRAGTTQVYRPLGVERLLEIPLHVMDTALFYPAYMDLSFEAADQKIGELVDTTIQFGGVITFNWHDRSIASERLWGECYGSLIDSLKLKGAWCTSAGSTAAWFRKRRAVLFRRNGPEIKVVYQDNDGVSTEDIPGLKLRIYNVRNEDGDCISSYDETVIGSRTSLTEKSAI